MMLRDALLALYERNGALTPEIVVEEASDPQDEVAQYFTDRLTWDEAEAAHRWRLEQAAHLIRKAKVVYQPTPRSNLREARAFWAMREPGRGYEPIEEIAQDPVSAQIMLQQAEREWRDLKARYSHLSEFVAMVQKDVEQLAA
jgi:hypothetical protein